MGDRVSALLADYGGGQSQPKRSRVDDLLAQSDDSGDQVEEQKTHEPDFIHYQAPDAPAHEPDLLEQFIEHADSAIKPHAAELQGAWDSAGDAASGLAGGLTGHLDQRLPFGIGDAIRDDRAVAAERSPVAEGGGELVGMVGSPLGRVATGEKLLGSAVAQGVNAGALGTARRVGDQTDDNTDVLQALIDSKGDAVTGGLLGGGAHVLGGAIDAAGGLMGRGANYLRRVAYGVQPSDVNEQLLKHGTEGGLDYARNEMSQLPEKLGLSNTIIPKSTSDYAVGAERLRKEAGALKGSALDRADAVVPPEHIDFAKDDILERLVGQHDADAAAFSSRGTEPELADMTRRLQERPISKPSELDAMKQEYEGNSYAKGEGSMEAGRAAANKVGADEARNRLGGIMAGANRADPGVLEDFVNGSQQFGDAATVEDIAKRAAAKGVVAPIVGGALGGVAGYQTRHDFQGAGLGAVGGALATRGAQNYGADFGANMLRLGEQGAGKLSQGAGAIEHAAGAMSADQAMQTSRGHELPNVINKLLQENPAALGRYRADFENAGRTPGGIAGLLNKLNRDQQWRTSMLPQLQSLTGASP